VSFFFLRTLFTEGETYALMRRFSSFLDKNHCTLEDSVRADKLRELPEIKNHPLRDRILYTYSMPISGDAKASVIKNPTVQTLIKACENLTVRTITCHEFIRMLGAFHRRATFDMKASAAFRLYDFTADDFITVVDIRTLFAMMVGQNVMTYELDSVAQQMLKEADVDGNNELNQEEFKRILKRMPDFMAKFSFSIEFPSY